MVDLTALIIHQAKIYLFSNVSGFIFPDIVKTLPIPSAFEYFDYKKLKGKFHLPQGIVYLWSSKL